MNTLERLEWLGDLFRLLSRLRQERRRRQNPPLRDSSHVSCFSWIGHSLLHPFPDCPIPGEARQMQDSGVRCNYPNLSGNIQRFGAILPQNESMSLSYTWT